MSVFPAEPRGEKFLKHFEELFWNTAELLSFDISVLHHKNGFQDVSSGKVPFGMYVQYEGRSTFDVVFTGADWSYRMLVPDWRQQEKPRLLGIFGSTDRIEEDMLTGILTLT